MATIFIGNDGENIKQIHSSRDRVICREDLPHAIKVRVRHKMTEVRSREEWVKGRFPSLRDNLRANLASFHRGNFEPVRSLMHQPAVIASAGPSLSDITSRAPGRRPYEAKRLLSAKVYATNQAASAIRFPDVYVCCESFNVNPDRRPHSYAGIVAIDAACHPNNISFSEEAGGEHGTFVFFRSDSIYSGLAARYGVEMLPYGTSVSTAAVSLAARHKAPVIVLIGQDLAIHPDGRYYADGIPGCEMRVTFEERDGVTWSIFPERPGKMGKPPLPVFEEDGLWVTQDFADLRAWFETFADTHPHIRLINATARGIDIRGWERMPIEAALDVCKQYDAPPQPERFPALSGDLVEDVRRVRRWEQAVPESIFWEIEERSKAHGKETSEETFRWAIEVARSAAEKMGLL